MYTLGIREELQHITEKEGDFSRTATGRGRTAEDLHWERLPLALARCNLDRLADCERARYRQYAERTADQRFGSALAAPEAIRLVSGEESATLQTIREQESGESDDDELTLQTHLLIAEIQSFSSVLSRKQPPNARRVRPRDPQPSAPHWAQTSEENLFLVLLIMAPLSQELEPPPNPVRFSPTKRGHLNSKPPTHR